MRYGKVYFYDRMGNRLTHQMPGGREDESITSMFRSPQPGHIKLSSGVSSISRVHDAYHPDYPFKPNFMALEESEMDFAEGGAEPPHAETDAQMSAKKC
uniref:Uncharacterized protein n=1 Tax=Ditylenchus dipsaci TaxID=166011 RepID=A0A915D043_9BILA